MAKICTTMAFICLTLLVLLNLSNSRYLLVELDGSPDMDGYRNGPGMEDTTKEAEILEPEEEPTDDLELEALPEDDEEGVMPEQEQKPTGRRSLNLNLTQLLDDAGGGYRSSN